MAHFTTPFSYDNLEPVHKALNGLLPSDIRIREISPAIPEFHARFSVISKIYHYKIYNDTVMDPFQRHYAYHSLYQLNASAMRDAAKHFVGKHDFSAFANVSRNDRTPNPVKIIFRFDVLELVILYNIFFNAWPKNLKTCHVLVRAGTHLKSGYFIRLLHMEPLTSEDCRD